MGALVSLTGLRADTALPAWQWAGWGGGGFYHSAVFHPSKDGVIYMGGDVCGVYKSEDHGRTWRLSNTGLADYGVYSLAVDRTAPDTVYASTEGGLCKSTDGGGHWRLLPNTGKKELRITGERNRSIRSIAVDPADGKIVYAASPAGKVYKSLDGGETWNIAYEKGSEQEPPETLRVQFGKVDQSWCGGIWLPLSFPQGVTSSGCAGFGFSFKGDGTVPQDCFLSLKTKEGVTYRSRNLRELFRQTQWGDVTLGARDFTLDPDYANKNPAHAQAYSGTPDWAAVVRMDFACIGPLMNDAPVGKFTKFFFVAAAKPHVVPALAGPEQGKPGTATGRLKAVQHTNNPDAASPSHVVPALAGPELSHCIVAEFSKSKAVQHYGNLRIGPLQGGNIYSVAVAQRAPSLVLAATEDAGLVISRDAGKTWSEAATPKKASSVAVAPSEPSILYATFFKDGVWKSTDTGRSWNKISQSLPKNLSSVEVAVSPANPLDVYLIATADWNGRFYYSNNGGETWTDSSQLTPDAVANPTLANEYSKTTALSAPKNITLNPLNPKELYIAANWRPCHSGDGGLTWAERVRGADISCIYDVRFFKGRTYASAMDEGVLVSSDNGGLWHALWPLKYDDELGGHYWRLAISDNKGADRIVSACSPWNTQKPSRLVVSEDGGKTFKRAAAGLPATNPHANTMWGTGVPRAMAADPKDPKTLYLGIDGDPSNGKEGGGVFKSTDGGNTWAALPSQPGSRRMFFGLAVDPTDSKRLYWGACGTGGGLWRTEDGGASWQHVFKNEQWVFNVHVAADGTVYCPGNNLWRSTDHGKSWKQLTKFPFSSRIIVAVETDPADAKRLWFATTTWGGEASGDVYETCDAGATWQEITSDLPYRKPMLLRYNPDTHELWAAGVCLFKCKR
jgi:photosystem II stability/assembly factor-like uncharacterized protein